MHLLLDLIYILLIGLLSPVVIYKMMTQEKYRAGLFDRLGLGTRFAVRFRGRGGPRPVWVHGVSVGEVLAARPLVESIEKQRPDLPIVISSTTNTGFQVARRIFPKHRVIYYPLDFSFAVRPVIDAVAPQAIILIELEIWPNFLDYAYDRGIPVILVNGRISERSYHGYTWIRWLLFRPLKKIRRFCVQTEGYAERFRRLGLPADQLVVTGNMKYDHPLPQDPERLEADVRRELGIDPTAPVIIAGSTHHPEERILLDIYRRLQGEVPALRLVLVPRHPERIGDVSTAIREAGFQSLRKTEIQAGKLPTEPAVILVDTMGELARIYAAGTVVFVGGSLIPHGGQNMLEPAVLGRAIVLGPHTFNFQSTTDLLLARDACVKVADAAALHDAFLGLLADERRRLAIGERARDAIAENVGATRRNLDVILSVLGDGRRDSARLIDRRGASPRALVAARAGG